MLVLTRKIGEKIIIGDNIVVEVVEIDRGKVRLGITCPRQIPVYRDELLSEEQRKAVIEKTKGG